MHVALESPDQPDVRQLIDELDAYQDTLYPPECRHVLDLAGLLQPQVRFVVVRDALGAAVACGAVVLQADHAEIKRLYVLDGARGRGLARQLMAQLEALLTVRGVMLARLETGIHQPEAIGLYRRLGYVECGPFGSYAPDPLSLFMEKRLT